MTRTHLRYERMEWLYGEPAYGIVCDGPPWDDYYAVCNLCDWMSVDQTTSARARSDLDWHCRTERHQQRLQAMYPQMREDDQ